MGQQRVSNIVLINIKREYVNSVVNNDIDRTIDIFNLAVKMTETAISFNMSYDLMSSYDRLICKNIFTSYIGLC